MKGLLYCFFTILICISVIARSADLSPLEAYSSLPAFQSAEISPAGNRLAYIQNLQDPMVSALAVFDFEQQKNSILTYSDNEKVRINWFDWANDNTIIVSLFFASSRDKVDTAETRLVAIDVDNPDNPRILIKPKNTLTRRENISQFQDNVIDLLPDDPDHILIAVDFDTHSMPSVYKLNINTLKKKRIMRGKLKIRDFLTDRQHKLRVGMSLNYKDGESLVLIKRQADADWETLFSYNALQQSGNAKIPLGFDGDPNILYYRAIHNGFWALFKINLSNNESELVYADENYDVNGRLLYSDKLNKVIGLTHAHVQGGRIYWDDTEQRVQTLLNESLSKTTNYIVSRDRADKKLIVYSESDFIPGTYYIFDTSAKTIGKLFEQYPLLTSDLELTHKTVMYKARDGVKIEGYLTLPEGAQGPLPTILHPHGGPGSRDYAGFDYWTSYFISRGYAVFRPNFRGSTGYGLEFALSQMGRWGLEMQDDLTDAAHWLINENIAKPEKICIVGASYGGYAAMMATVKTPELFTCAISFAGVSNLKELVSTSRHYLNSMFVRQQIGDDSDDLKARSPFYLADKVQTPLLLIHGEKDIVVDVKQSRMMADELIDLEKNVNYIELKNGNHSLGIQRNRHIFFQEMEKFLRSHL